ncbi:MAG: hypothetical protein IT174_06170 [Acidobacteria bacterium]|nr:hypothetical protein [Acidobacteriota bacterium]
MKNIKNIVAAFLIVTFLSVSTFAGDGILVTGRDGILVTGVAAEPTPCTASAVDGILVTGRDGILVTGFAGILVTGFTGILVTGLTGTSTCRGGLLISD